MVNQTYFCPHCRDHKEYKLIRINANIGCATCLKKMGFDVCDLLLPEREKIKCQNCNKTAQIVRKSIKYRTITYYCHYCNRVYKKYGDFNGNRRQ